MSVLEAVAVAAIVLGAAAYLLRRFLRSLSGRSCGCGPASEKGCPAARSLAGEFEHLARRSGTDARD